MLDDEQFGALMARVRARQPERCPACGSARIQPLCFDDTDTWDCAEPDCCAIWAVLP